MKKMMPFEKSAKDKKSDKGMKERSKADMLKDKMMKSKMASGGKAMSPRGAMTGGGKPMMGSAAVPGGGTPMMSPRGAMTGGAKPAPKPMMGGAMAGIKKGYRKGGMCK
jgi:hypothetical protein